MKHYKKYFSYRHWVSVLKKQPVHMQHVYALVFSGGVTVLLAATILYFDYGFWRERYTRGEEVGTSTEEIASESPFEMFSSFLNEAKNQYGAIKASTTNMLEGTEVYTNEENQTTFEIINATTTP